MKRLVYIGLPLATVLLITLSWLDGARKQETGGVDNRPWAVTVNGQGTTRVFGIDLGTTSLKTARQLFKAEPEIAIFRYGDDTARLEAYFGKLVLGSLQAKVIVRLQSSEQTLNRFIANSPAGQPTPSGRIKLRLASSDFALAESLIISELSYAPAVDTDPQVLRRLFGEPENVLEMDANSSYWSYPSRGVVLLINREDKEIFHYFNPADAEQVMHRLKNMSRRSNRITG